MNQIQLNLKGETPLEAFENHLKIYKGIPQNCCFGFSGGDDSTVLVDKAVDMFGSDICVVFCNTHVQFKQTYDFVKRMVEYWGLTNFVELHPIESFITVSRRVGLHGVAHNKMICCSSLKNTPLSRWMHKNGKTISICGIRRTEAVRNCGYPILSYSQYHDIRYFSPMLFMSDADVARYYEETGCPKNPLYHDPYNIDRSGCAPCPNALKLKKAYSDGYATYYDWLYDKFPRWYKYAWLCQKRFYDRKCKNGDQRGYDDYLYKHKWKWSLMKS